MRKPPLPPPHPCSGSGFAERPGESKSAREWLSERVGFLSCLPPPPLAAIVAGEGGIISVWTRFDREGCRCNSARAMRSPAETIRKISAAIRRGEGEGRACVLNAAWNQRCRAGLPPPPLVVAEGEWGGRGGSPEFRIREHPRVEYISPPPPPPLDPPGTLTEHRCAPRRSGGLFLLRKQTIQWSRRTYNGGSLRCRFSLDRQTDGDEGPNSEGSRLSR